jgi:hypothetical protein
MCAHDGFISGTVGHRARWCHVLHMIDVVVGQWDA